MHFSLISTFLALINPYSHGKAQTRSLSAAPKRGNSMQMVSATMAERWATLSSTIASLMFAWAIICQYSPYEVRNIIEKLKQRLRDYFNPYIQLCIHEYTGERLKRSEGYVLVESYLSSITSKDANRLRADLENDGGNLVLSMDEFQKVTDEFEGAQVWWGLRRISASSRTYYPEQGKRFYKLVFNKKHRELITKSYLDHVMKKGKDIRARNRQRKLFTNIPGSYNKMSSGMWSHIVFEHPASFETMALDPEKKEEIVEDLLAFSRNKEFYQRAGKAWKRGYLLYGPPGTGKSTMVAAMANLLNYDVYDLELTAVRDNTELRRLLIETTSKSVIVIEDIDCSLDLTGQRKKNKDEKSSEEDRDMTDEPKKERKEEPKKERKEVPKEDGSSRVTLSGLLNFIDGIWSCCGSERVIVFTTNYVEKLDHALIRSGRMDKHIELSYCSFKGFKVFAKNYLNLETHQTFDKIESLMGVTNITPADVAENLVPKSPRDDPEKCLSNLIRTLEEAKEAADKKKKAKEAQEMIGAVQPQDEKETEKPE
ncbi:hypothetical protein TIFTF001_014965 [Ficus carica]|uniref:AAA+ ATPase domain-containing protein n=1 Tax=Ficus carica TaxID=3494 RepID=A0AA88D4M3_FICCA|nr:hypothetical protein TIFTF001_014965 [Ficus carica]